jgi:hypothetical protein
LHPFLPERVGFPCGAEPFCHFKPAVPIEAI